LRALIDASFCKAPEGGEDTGPNPTDRRKSGSKHHVLTDAQGVPLNATVTAANVNEVTQVLDVLVHKPAVGGKPGPKRERPERLQGDGGYDSEPLRVLDPDTDPLLTVAIANVSTDRKPRRVCVKAYLEGLSAEAVRKTLSLREAL
jgi:hypothetical protein